MNLYRLELKRVCKTRMTAILLAIALVLTVVMAYLSFHLIRIFPDEIFPTVVRLGHGRLPHLQEMAVGGSQSVRGVHIR